MAGLTRLGLKASLVKSVFESVAKISAASVQATSSRNVQTTSDHGQQSALKEENEGMLDLRNNPHYFTHSKSAFLES